MLINTKTKEELTEAQFRLAHPNTSFPEKLTDAVLSKLNFAVLTYPPAPVAPPGKKVVSAGAANVNGAWSMTYKVVDLPPAEAESFAADVRAQRSNLLAASDWTQVADAPVNKAAWAAYRQALRDVTKQQGFPFNVQWPSLPNT